MAYLPDAERPFADWLQEGVRVREPLLSWLRPSDPTVRRYELLAWFAGELRLPNREYKEPTERFLGHLCDKIADASVYRVSPTRAHAYRLVELALWHIRGDDLLDLIHDFEIRRPVEGRDAAETAVQNRLVAPVLRLLRRMDDGAAPHRDPVV